MTNLSFPVALTLLMTLSACATKPTEVKPSEVDEVRILAAIESSAKVIADAQRVTAESQNAIRAMTMTEQQKTAYSEAMSYVPPNMERPISVFFRNEEMEKAAKMLAMLTNYDFNVVNPAQRPRNGVLVTVESQGRSGYDVARDIGTQAGTRADLNIKPYSSADRKTSKFGLIEVEYK